MLFTGNQLAAGRALAGIDHDTLAKAANMPAEIIRVLEAKGSNPLSGRPEMVQRIQIALGKFGVEFTNGDAPGVRLRQGPVGDPSASIPVEKLTSANDE